MLARAIVMRFFDYHRRTANRCIAIMVKIQRSYKKRMIQGERLRLELRAALNDPEGRYRHIAVLATAAGFSGGFAGTFIAGLMIDIMRRRDARA